MKKYSAFTIPEALLILLLASLLSVAIVPGLTKKHKELSVHGKWTCTIDNQGNHYVKTEYNGKESNFTYAGNNCTFTPPANAKTFTIKAAAGGGGGAGGTTGDEGVIFDSNLQGETFVSTVDTDGYYTVLAVGAGGGGGGMGCGTAQDYYKENAHIKGTFNNSNYLDINTSSVAQNVGSKDDPADGEDWTWNYTNAVRKSNPGSKDVVNTKPENISGAGEKTYTYGHIDLPVSDFRYDLLYKNDYRFSQDLSESTQKIDCTDKNGNKDTNNKNKSIYDFKYCYLKDDAITLKDKNLCFATKNVPLSTINVGSAKFNEEKGIYRKYEENGKIACWNLPGQGGGRGSQVTADKVFLSAGQNLVASVGRGGKGQFHPDSAKADVQLYNPKDNSLKKFEKVILGDGGLDGTDTNVIVGGYSYTGRAGKGGYGRVVQYKSYTKIPVMECNIIKTEKVYNDVPVSRCTRYSGKTTTYNVNGCASTRGCDSETYSYLTSCKPQSGDTASVCNKSQGRNPSRCTNQTYIAKNSNGTQVIKNCVATTEERQDCEPTTHTGPYYEVGSNCRKVVRDNYLSIPVCINSNSNKFDMNNTGDPEIDILNADIPGIFGTRVLLYKMWHQGQDSGPGYYTGNTNASGGYGIGQSSMSYLVYNEVSEEYSARLQGYDGKDGYATIKQISYAAGGGGEAGQYTNLIMKKTGKLSISIGGGGIGSNSTDNPNGGMGGSTIVKDADGNTIIALNGGRAGKPKATEAQMASGTVMGGVNGALSPFESPYNKARVVPYGGKIGTNYSMHGVSPNTPVWKDRDGYNSGQLVVSYGAGGGGGAASKNEAGWGGNGAPGAVVIEW